MLSANFKEFSIILALEIKSDPKPGHSVGYRKFCDFCSLRDNVMGRNKKIILKYSVACAAMSLALIQGGSAFADDAAGDDDSVRNMNQITVYGEKRETTLQDAPIALSAITSDILDQAGITDPSQLNGYVPGLMITKSGGSERIVTIRGVGQQTPENFATIPGVSFHVDGAFLPNSIALNMGFSTLTALRF